MTRRHRRRSVPGHQESVAPDARVQPCPTCGGTGDRNGNLRAADPFGLCPTCGGTRVVTILPLPERGLELAGAHAPAREERGA